MISMLIAPSSALIGRIHDAGNHLRRLLIQRLHLRGGPNVDGNRLLRSVHGRDCPRRGIHRFHRRANLANGVRREVGDFDLRDIRVLCAQHAEVIAPDAAASQAQVELLDRFVRAIETGTPPETSGQDNLWSFGAVMAGVRSAQEGRSVFVREVLDDVATA